MRKIASVALLAFICCFAVGAAEGTTITSPWMPVLGDFIQLLIEILTPILVTLGSWAAWRLAKKLGVDKNIAADALLRKYIKEAINYADAWAKKQSGVKTEEDKKAQAVKYVLELIKNSSIPAMTEERLMDMVEAQLEFDKKTLKFPELDEIEGPELINE